MKNIEVRTNPVQSDPKKKAVIYVFKGDLERFKKREKQGDNFGVIYPCNVPIGNGS